MLLKMLELQDVPLLFELMRHPEVFPYLRQKPGTIDEYYFYMRKNMEAENKSELISRTITDEYHFPIGNISLYDMQENFGFLSTWIGRPYFGKGYNRRAKEAFFNEVFQFDGLEGIFMKVRKINFRSARAALKLPYVTSGNDIYPEIYKKINEQEEVYDLFTVTRKHYLSCRQFTEYGNASAEEEVV
jgi:RimJ/RimL family protein N-acetyltransferase